MECVNCNSNNLTVFRKIDGYSLFRCNDCNLVATKFLKVDRNKYTENKYNQDYTENYYYALPKLYSRYKRLISLFIKDKRKGKLLDIGCGTGHFIKFFKESYPEWEVFGVEPNGLLRKAAIKNTNIRVVNGKMDNIPFKDNHFDIVTCFDVLEHSVDLNNNINEIKRVLKPKGYILVQAPNFMSFMAMITGNKWDWWCVPDHVFHFSYRFLLSCFTKGGFSIVNSYTYQDSIDFFSNIRGVMKTSIYTKILYVILFPFLIVVEKVGWFLNMGGLSVVLAEKKI